MLLDRLVPLAQRPAEAVPPVRADVLCHRAGVGAVVLLREALARIDADRSARAAAAHLQPQPALELPPEVNQVPAPTTRPSLSCSEMLD